MTPQHAGLSRAPWQKSTYSGSNGGQCVEVACNLPGIVAVRDSKDPTGPKLIVASRDWTAFVRRVTGDEPDEQVLIPAGRPAVRPSRLRHVAGRRMRQTP
jgi:hypothetical protein